MSVANSTISESLIGKRNAFPKYISLGKLIWALPIAFLGFVVLYPLGALFLTLGNHGVQIFQALFSERIGEIFLNTAAYTILTTIWGLALGISLAWALSRRNDRTTDAARALIAIAFVLPEFIYGVAYVFLLDPSAGYITRLFGVINVHVSFPLYGLWGMSLITGLFCVPQVVMIVEPALRNVGSDLEEAAEICGSTGINTLLRVTFPSVSPAILMATLLTFLLAFASFGIPAALGIPHYFYVLSTEVYSVVLAYPPRFDIAAGLSILFLLVGLLVSGGQLYATRLAFRYRTVGGKGFHGRRKTPPIFLRRMLDVFIWIMVLAVSILPIGVVVAVSFAKHWWQLPGALTLAHYVFVLIKDPLIPSIAFTTISVAAVTVIITLALAMALSIFGLSGQGRVRSLVRLLGYLALSVPGIAFTVGALLAYIAPPFDFYGTIWILVFTYCARFYPLAAGPIAAGLGQLDPGLSESALITGAGALRSFWRIQLPLIRPTVIAGALIVMMFSVRELLSAVFLQSSQIKMAMVSVFNYWDEGSLSNASAMSSTIAVICILIFVVANRLRGGVAWRH